MIKIETNDEGLCRELMSGYHDRKPIKVGGSEYVICEITRNFDTSLGGSVEARGDIVRNKTWTGQGLPPDGTVCLDSSGSKVVIVAHHANGTHAIFAESMDAGLLYYGAAGDFQPIKTPEQLAAEARTKACDRMYGVIIDSLPEDRRRNGSDIVEALYDAGYRLTKQVGE